LSDASQAPIAAEREERRLEWRVHMARAAPRRTAGVILAAAGAGAVTWLVFANPLLALAAIAIVIASVAEFLFPIHYRLTERGAEMRYGLSRSLIDWPQVRKCYLFPDGVKLSPLRVPSRLEAFRGVFLRFADNREQVLEFVRQARGTAGQ
jgi:hypothetical protein